MSTSFGEIQEKLYYTLSILWLYGLVHKVKLGFVDLELSDFLDASQ